VYRILRGGIGTLPGVLVILMSGILGLVWRRWVRPKSVKLRWLYIYLMGLLVHAVMLACQLFLPYPERLDVISEIFLPVIAIYPVATLLLCLLLYKQREFWQMRDELKQSEERVRQLFETMAQSSLSGFGGENNLGKPRGRENSGSYVRRNEGKDIQSPGLKDNP
jgi:LytS/YehU family sensor histidine kinase